MDHISCPPNATVSPAKVPFVCAEGEICPRNEFFRWTNKQELFRLPLQKFAAKLQSWLYFGLLSAFLTEEISPERVVMDDPDMSGRRILDSVSVRRLVRKSTMKKRDSESASDRED